MLIFDLCCPLYLFYRIHKYWTKGIIYLLCEMREYEESRVGEVCYLTTRAQEIAKVLIWYLHLDKKCYKS